MGWLSNDSYLQWKDIKKNFECIQKRAIKQFINIFNQHKDRKDDILYWGDEIEYMLVKFDDEKKTSKLCLKSSSVLSDLERRGRLREPLCSWHPEFTTYMIEGIPGKPYCGFRDILHVEKNMEMRRTLIMEVLESNEFPLCLGSYPGLGTKNFTSPDIKIAEKSVPEIIYCGHHPRFEYLERNIEERKGSQGEAFIPVWKDRYTKCQFTRKEQCNTTNVQDDFIYMDGIAYGGGCCALQVTMQATDITQARLIFDQLSTLSPFLLALSAASPIFRGYLSDFDVRWPVMYQIFDDRTEHEKKEKNDCQTSRSKSRFSSIDRYILPRNVGYNDVDLEVDEKNVDKLLDAGVDRPLAVHIASLLVREPLILTKESLCEEDNNDTNLIENILSQDWHSVRLKAPTDNLTGWRIEFRPLEVQISSFENAAYSVFVFLLTRAILFYDLDFVVPISKIDENMEVAYKIDAVSQGMFHFKKNVLKDSIPSTKPTATTAENNVSENLEDEICQLTINEIFNGSDELFPGLINIVRNFVENLQLDHDTNCTIRSYLKLLSERASGAEPTIARHIRDYVTHHPDYKWDSVVSESIIYGLLKSLAKRTDDYKSNFTKI